MNVSFDDVPGGKATLRTAYTNCTSTVANGQSPTLAIFIRSITNLPLGNITFNGSTTASIEFGSITPVTLEVPSLTIPRHPDEANPVTQLAQGYEWTIPAGWLWPDGSASNGTARLFNSRNVSSPNRIVVTPSANTCEGGTTPVIRVKAVDTECLVGAVAGYVPTKSAEATPLPITCTTPTLTIISSRTPSGGNFSLFCGNGADNGFRYIVTPSSAMPGFTFNAAAGDQWQVTAPLLLTGPTSATPTIVASGVGTGTVRLTMTYTRNGAKTRVSATPVTVTVSSASEPPVFTAGTIGTVCTSDEDYIVQVAKPSNLGLRWWSDADVLFPDNAAHTSSNPYITANNVNQIGLLVGTSGIPGNRQVVAQTFSALCSTGSQPRILNISFGPPDPIQVNGLVNPAQLQTAMYLSIANPNLSLSYAWSSPGNTLAVAANGLSATLYTKLLGNNTLTITAGNECGDTNFAGNFYVYPATAARILAHPNPANDALELASATPSEVYSVTLYDGQGQAVRQLREGSGRRVLDTRKLPAGLYRLVSQDATGRLTRQTIQVSH